MRYDIIVALVFATERVSEDKYDLLEIQNSRRSGSPQDSSAWRHTPFEKLKRMESTGLSR